MGSKLYTTRNLWIKSIAESTFRPKLRCCSIPGLLCAVDRYVNVENVNFDGSHTYSIFLPGTTFDLCLDQPLFVRRKAYLACQIEYIPTPAVVRRPILPETHTVLWLVFYRPRANSRWIPKQTYTHPSYIELPTRPRRSLDIPWRKSPNWRYCCTCQLTLNDAVDNRLLACRLLNHRRELRDTNLISFKKDDYPKTSCLRRNSERCRHSCSLTYVPFPSAPFLLFWKTNLLSRIPGSNGMVRLLLYRASRK